MTKTRVLLPLAILGLLVLGFQNCAKAVFQKDESSSLGKYGEPPVCRPLSASEVAPRLKWDWKSQLPSSPAPRYDNFDQVMAAPMVGDLAGDGHPSVVFTTFSTNSADRYGDALSTIMYVANGVLRIVDGATGKTKFSVGSADLAPFSSSSPLLMDIDGDGKMEIFYAHYSGKKIIALNYDGSFRWSYVMPSPMGFTMIGPSAGPILNNIGSLVYGPYVLSETTAHAPVLRATAGDATIVSTSTTLALPLDPQHAPADFSIVNSAGIYKADGRLVGRFANAAVYLAAGDIYPDIPGVEIIATGASAVKIYNGLTAQLIKSVDLNQFNDLKCPSGVVGGGPATVGKFDGTGEVQIAIATGRYLTIFDTNMQPKYKYVTQDCSSVATGITSFDLNGDGKPEILYGDEQYLRIFDVEDGQLTPAVQFINPSGTLNEYPVIADLTNTQTSNLIVVSNNYAVSSLYSDPAAVAEASKITGVRVFESSASRSWMPSRPIWNQYSFHPDLVTDHGRINDLMGWDATYFRRNNQGNRVDMQCVNP